MLPFKILVIATEVLINLSYVLIAKFNFEFKFGV